MNLLTAYFEDFFSLVFPEVCQSCGNGLYKHEKLICTACTIDLPVTNFHTFKDNEVEKLFWGRVNFEFASAFLYFHRGNKVQQLMHQFKYKGKKEVGQVLGSMYGQTLANMDCWNTDCILIPVPLHPKKLHKRGYNQSEWIAKGLSDSLQIEYRNDILIRTVESSTQTKKNRFERWENVSSIFSVLHASDITNKHIILVDDVVTTGATIEACAATLLAAAPCKISLLALAVASK